MTIRMTLSEIPLFKGCTSSTIKTLTSIFKAINGEKGLTLIKEDKVVSGLFIIVEGEVVVALDENKTELARLGRGASFGEMSLIKEGEVASATICVASDTIQYLFCDRGVFLDMLNQDPVFSADFFKGASLLLSERLRTTNAKMDNELAEGYKNIKNIINNLEVGSKLDKTRNSLDQTGANIVTKIYEIIPEIDKIRKDETEHNADLKKVSELLEEIALIDSQNFDRVCQMLDQIKQNFDNLKRIIYGGQVQEIKGDAHLFKSSNKTT